MAEQRILQNGVGAKQRHAHRGNHSNIIPNSAITFVNAQNSYLANTDNRSTLNMQAVYPPHSTHMIRYHQHNENNQRHYATYQGGHPYHNRQQCYHGRSYQNGCNATSSYAINQQPCAHGHQENQNRGKSLNNILNRRRTASIDDWKSYLLDSSPKNAFSRINISQERENGHQYNANVQHSPKMECKLNIERAPSCAHLQCAARPIDMDERFFGQVNLHSATEQMYPPRQPSQILWHNKFNAMQNYPSHSRSVDSIPQIVWNNTVHSRFEQIDISEDSDLNSQPNSDNGDIEGFDYLTHLMNRPDANGNVSLDDNALCILVNAIDRALPNHINFNNLK